MKKPGGPTAIGPDATNPPPPGICQNLPGEGGGGQLGRGGGGRREGLGVLAAWPGAGGAVRNPLLSHAYLKGLSGGMGV